MVVCARRWGSNSEGVCAPSAWTTSSVVAPPPNPLLLEEEAFRRGLATPGEFRLADRWASERIQVLRTAPDIGAVTAARLENRVCALEYLRAPADDRVVRLRAFVAAHDDHVLQKHLISSATFRDASLIWINSARRRDGAPQPKG